MTTPEQSVQPSGRRVGPLALGVTLLMSGVALSYLTLTRRWGYYSGIPLDPSQVIPEDRAGYRRVRDALSIPIAGGECEYTRYGFQELFIRQCVDIAQPDLCVCGGFSEWLKIHALASSFGVLTIPHVWGSGVALAAALHALAVIPPSPHTANPITLQNEPVVEFDRTQNPLRDELLSNKFVLERGALLVPQGPGLGVNVNDDMLAKYSVKR